jgi:hypothetical protein
MDIKVFDSNEDMFSYIREQNKIAREWADTHDAVEIIDQFTYFLISMEDLLIVGKKEPATLPIDQYDSEEEYRYEKESAEEDKKNGYVWARWYSEIVPDGELGTNHLSHCVPVSDEVGKFILNFISKK